MKTLRSAVVLGALAAAGGAQAAGFAIESNAARATGMSTAVAAVVDDASSIFYNPAGLVRAEGFHLLLGDTLIAPGVRIEPAGGGEALTNSPSLSPPPHLYASYGFGKVAAVGVGVTVPYGASTAWPQDWEGRYLTTGSSLSTYDIAPTLSFALHERFRLGGSFRALRGTVDLRRDINFVDSQGSVRLGGGAWGYGWSLGAQFDLAPQLLTLGANYRSAVRLDFAGNGHFEDVPRDFQALLHDGPVRAGLTLPALLLMGVGLTPFEGLKLDLDVHWTEHSAFQSLDIDWVDNEAVSSSTPKRWRNTFSYHLGGEYQLEALALRAGLAYDPTPSPPDTLTPDIPDGDRFRFSLGGGYRFGPALRADLAYQGVVLLPTESTAPALPATYSGYAHVVALTLGLALR